MSSELQEQDYTDEIDHEGELWNAGHRACAGCGPANAMKYITEAAGENTIIAQPTGCMEVVSTPYPESAWGVSYIHNIFENAASVASGIEAAYQAFDRRDPDHLDVADEDDLNIIAVGGDGATADIGFRALSGMMERGHDVTYIMYDNEAYMNTGVQRSSQTPYGAETTTSPHGEASVGNDTNKKDMASIAAAHGVDYVATASISNPHDFKQKIETALERDGPKFLHVYAPCPVGWGYDSSKTVELARLAVETGLFPVFEMEGGEITNIRKVSDRKPIEEFVKYQKRFSHLVGEDGDEEGLAELQAWIDGRAEDLGIDA
ncbi:thiamine pyrophosphate-dependent enzyme [Halococcoides cellulosivorans]|uniref:Pyruvate ferredoxin oxidoreductase n=1 Tax=Halococcoides cellulosivorans TaxID=1679096 RepID=A0A2R4WZW8_9EURY|nr:thiamine pyrophosphate-dependent enzyme [Halococcoides cellulosivorans]AWB27096.1 pyruvate ferredoxin oxidoreductase [Halococcoides cellulosivorans]